MHDYPETASFLTNRERTVVLDMLQEDDHLATHFDKKFIWQAISDYKTWLQVGIYMRCTSSIFNPSIYLTPCGSNKSISIPVTAIALFLPTIVRLTKDRLCLVAFLKQTLVLGERPRVFSRSCPAPYRPAIHRCMHLYRLGWHPLR